MRPGETELASRGLSPYTLGIGGLIRDAAELQSAPYCSQSDSLTLEVPSSETSAWRAVVRHLRSWPPLFPDALRSPLHDVSSVLFPSPCRVLRTFLCGSAVPICDDCWNRVTPQTGQVCARCSEDLHVSAFTHVGGSESGPADRLCQPCRLAPPPFERAVAYGGYTGIPARADPCC